MCFFSIWKNICQKEELCNTSVGCSWLLCKVCNPKKWCLLVKGSYCASSLPAQPSSRCLSEQRTRTRDLQALCAEATLPLCFSSSRADPSLHADSFHKRYLLMFKKIAYRPISASQISRHTGVVWNASWNFVSFCVFLNFFVTTSLSTAFNTPPYPTSFNFTIWCRIWGVQCNVRLCRKSVEPVMKVIDFCHCSTVGARDCFLRLNL